MGDCIARPRHRDEHHLHNNCHHHAMTIASGAALSPSWTVRGYCASFVPCGGRSVGGRLAVCARLAYGCAGGLPVTAQSSELARPSFFCRATRRSVQDRPHPSPHEPKLATGRAQFLLQLDQASTGFPADPNNPSLTPEGRLTLIMPKEGKS
jgi:hypothetical protein